MPKLNLNTVSGFTQTLAKYEKSIQHLLKNKHDISAEEFFVTCVNAVKKAPKLLFCEPSTLFGAILVCAELGLKPNTHDQHCFIIPYGKEAQFQIGYKGLIEIMYRNPRVRNITANAVYEKDEFRYHYGLNPDLIHVPLQSGDKGKLTHVYAICKLNDADPVFTVVHREELDKIRKLSKTINSAHSPYNNGTDIHNYMEIKAGVKKLSKLIPKTNTPDISKAVDYDSLLDVGAKIKIEMTDDENGIYSAILMDAKDIANSFENAFDEDLGDANIVDDTMDKSEQDEQENQEDMKENPEAPESEASEEQKIDDDWTTYSPIPEQTNTTKPIDFTELSKQAPDIQETSGIEFEKKHSDPFIQELIDIDNNVKNPESKPALEKKIPEEEITDTNLFDVTVDEGDDEEDDDFNTNENTGLF